MILFKNSNDLRKHLSLQRSKGLNAGFVPTMGALHKGHVSLIHRSKTDSRFTVCSVFINPTQFNDQDDFEKYPVTIKEDILALESAGCEVLFLPSVKEIYPKGVGELASYDLGHLEEVLEGRYRPGHFQGVCNVMDRLLRIIAPANVYLGQKDYQQCLVIERMMKLTGLNKVTNLHTVPTLRENDGLAMSSRNLRLNENERKLAPAIFRELKKVQEVINPGRLGQLKSEAAQSLDRKGFKVDYFEIADNNLRLLDEWDGKQEIVVLVAAYLNEVRLIDNIIIKERAGLTKT